jgi:ribA/ribD-fused uncharacterized protein
MNVITSFTGQYGFLSNFHPAPFYLPGQLTYWKTAEHCFQACKAPTLAKMEWIASADSPAEAKSRGRSVALPGNWESQKRAVMLSIVLAKFTAHGNEQLRERLKATGPAVLVEGNRWGDDYWGAVPGAIGAPHPCPVWVATPDDPSYVLYGHNWLGRILMMVRDVA